MNNLKVGNRIICTDKYDSNNTMNEIGTIRRVNGNGSDGSYDIEFDNLLNSGHNLSGLLQGDRRNHGWTIAKQYIELYKPVDYFMKYIGDKYKGKRVSVIRNGNTYKLVKTGGEVVVAYIPTKNLIRKITTTNRTELEYIALFEEAINACIEAQTEKEVANVV